MLIPLASAGALALTVDQVSKSLVLARSADEGRELGRRGIRPVRTPGIGGGRIRSARSAALLWLAALAGVLALANAGPFAGAWGGAFLGLALGGASGNALDLVRRGAVIDFVDLRVWPVFNLADVAIVAGAAGALVVWAGSLAA